MLVIGDLTIDADSVVEVDGLESPDVRTNDTSRPLDDGEFLGSDFLAGRTLTVTFEVLGNDMNDFSARVREVERVLVPRRDVVFKWQTPLNDWRVATVRIRRRNVKYDRQFWNGYAQYTVELRAADPRLYGDTTKVEQFTLGSSVTTTAVTFPLNVPFTIGAHSTPTGQKSVLNEGNYLSDPVFRFHGPVTNPRITNSETGEFVEITTTVPEGQYLDINTTERTVLTSAGVSQYGNRTDSSKWLRLEPGETLLRFTAHYTTPASSRVEVIYRDAWV